MLQGALALLTFLCSIISVAADAPAGTRTCHDNIIKLNVGGVIYITTMETVCKYKNSPLAAKFAPDAVNITEEGTYFLDEDPVAFDDILYFLRYGELYQKNSRDINRLTIAAKKLLPKMLKSIHFSPIKIKKIPLTIIKKNVKPNKDSFFLCHEETGIIMGSKDSGGNCYGAIKPFLDEYNRRNAHQELCYSWSGFGNSIYNVASGIQIGETVNGAGTQQLLADDDSFFNLNLIENAERTQDGRLFVCSFNNSGTFSIFNAHTGKKLRPNECFSTVNDCTAAIRKYLANGGL